MTETIVEDIERFNALGEAQQMLIELFDQASRHVTIMSDALPNRLFGHPLVTEALKRFILQDSRNKLSIQVEQVRHWLTDGHGWLDLIQRLNSRIEVLVWQPEMLEQNNLRGHWVMADRSKLWACQSLSPVTGFLNLNDAPNTRKMHNRAEEVRRYMRTARELRRLS